jgi:hypothetical protein
MSPITQCMMENIIKFILYQSFYQKNYLLRKKLIDLTGRKYNLGVIVDLHAANGSQNGNDHSGTRDGTQKWGTTDENINQTVAVIDFLASRYWISL